MEQTTPAFHPLDYVAVLRRRLWWLVVPIVLAMLTGAALLAFLPRTYKTSARVGVSIPTLSPDIASAQRLTPEERLRNIRQVLLSQPVLERVVRDEGLDEGMSIAEAMAYLRERVTTEFPRDAALPADTLSEFTIAYSDATPERAQRLTNRIADVFVEETSMRRAMRAQETSMFISAQLQQSEERLADLEERLAAAKEASMGALPQQTSANIAMVTAMQQGLDTTTNAIRGEQERLSIIQQQIDALEAPVAGETPAAASPAAARVLALEQELAALRAVYTDRWPRIVELREELERARVEAAEEAKRPPEDRLAALRFNPTYQALLKSRDQANLRINDLKREEARIREQIATYRERVEQAPRVEQQLQTLQREYELEKDQYVRLTERLRAAEMNENLVRNRGGEEFTVLAYAPFPTAPDTPNTQRLLLVTLLFGCCLGGGLALGREYLDRSIHDARSLDDIDLPVLGEIPRIVNAQ